MKGIQVIFCLRCDVFKQQFSPSAMHEQEKYMVQKKKKSETVIKH